jgi:hypothetical protein
MSWVGRKLCKRLPQWAIEEPKIETQLSPSVSLLASDQLSKDQFPYLKNRKNITYYLFKEWNMILWG